MKYSVDMPYPNVKVEKKDKELAKKILSLYAGEVSEDTSSHNYIFQMLMFSENKELKEIFEGIAIVEMHHLEILGTLIKELGLAPVFLSIEAGKIKWFSGNYVNYNKNLRKILLKNIEIEKMAISNYERIIKETNDKNIVYLFKRIILDERLHIEIFEKLLQQIN